MWLDRERLDGNTQPSERSATRTIRFHHPLTHGNETARVSGFAKGDEDGPSLPVDVLNRHSEHLGGSHSSVLHDHDHIPQRLIRNRKQFGFGFRAHELGTSHFLCQMNLGSPGDAFPIYSLAQHPMEGAERIVDGGR